jgi:NADPH:quinone reductase
MRAIQVQKPGGPEALTLVDIPIPAPKPAEALVKLSASGVNFIDIYLREGRYPAALPFVDGQEGAGIVTAVGSDVKSVKTGDRVAFSSILGAYAEYMVAPAERLVPVPAGIADHQAAAVMLQGMTAHYLVHDTYPVKSGDAVLVHAAAGGTGLLLVQMAKNLGARVIGAAGSAEKANLARQAGADEVIVYSQQDFQAETKRLTDGKGVNVVYDGVGATTFDKGLNVLRPRGYMVLFGAASGPVVPVDPIKLMQKGALYLTRPSLAYYTATPAELHARAGSVLSMVAQGKLKLRIEYKYPLENAQQAHRDLEGRKTTGKLLLIP